MINQEEIIEENQGLIYKLAHKYSIYANIEDLYQAGCIGILQGINNYDKNQGKFSSYIYPYILGEMINLVNENNPLKVSRDTIKLRKKIIEAKDRLTQILMREPTNEEICNLLEIPDYYIAEALNSRVKIQSIDDVVGDGNILLHEIISNPKTDYDELIYLKMQIENLEEPERTIMIERYLEDKTQKEVANSLGIKQVQISRKEGKVLSKIRNQH